MNAITRANNRSRAFVNQIPAGSRLWRTCKDEAADVIVKTSDMSGWDEDFLMMIHEAITGHEGHGDILAAAFLIEEMARNDDILDLIQAALISAQGDIDFVMDIFVELIDDEEDLEEAALDVEAICWKNAKGGIGMKNKNQIVCDRIDGWDLPRFVREYVDSTDYGIMDELYGKIETADDLIRFVSEMFLEENEYQDPIEAVIRFEIKQGQAAYEMLMDGYRGDIEEYIADYAGDYEAKQMEDGSVVVTHVAGGRPYIVKDGEVTLGW